MKLAILKPNSSQIAGNIPFIASFCRLANIHRMTSKCPAFPVLVVAWLPKTLFTSKRKHDRTWKKWYWASAHILYVTLNNGRVLNSLTTTCCWVTFENTNKRIIIFKLKRSPGVRAQQWKRWARRTIEHGIMVKNKQHCAHVIEFARLFCYKRNTHNSPGAMTSA